MDKDNYVTRFAYSLALTILVSVMFLFMVKSCIDQDRKECLDKQGYYFRGHCIKDGKFID